MNDLRKPGPHPLCLLASPSPNLICTSRVPCLAAGEHAARSTEELFQMARQLDSRIGILEGLAERLNAEHTTTDVSNAIDDGEY